MSTLTVIVITIIMSAFFSGMEIAFVSSNKLRVEIDYKQRRFGSGIVKRFIDRPGVYIVTMLIGNNISLVIYGLFTAKLLEPFLSSLIESDLLVLLSQTIISTFVILVLAEFLPKAVFRLAPNSFLNNLSFPTLLFYITFFPLTWLIIKLSNGLLRIFFGASGQEKPEDMVFSKVDLDNLVNEVNEEDNESDLEQHDIRIFQNALDLSNVKVRACMVPRTEVVALPANSSLDDLKQTFIDTGHSNILIYEDTIDKITGYFRLRDLFRTPDSINSAIRKIPIVPESMAANNLLKLFVEENKKLALVVDEFGGTSGIVTLEDVLEEIVGEIEDEHDSSGLTERKIGDSEYLFSGRLEIDYINEAYKLSLPASEEYETLAGLVFSHHGSIPKINEVIEIENIRLKILKITDTRLELINVKIIK
ncbi:MAG: hemolysin family protein [Marinilabiliaceae bacterium]|jgi:CBS domain containing-hemolysin-like protein|nr:hemolysin family protein [Marinilabiliaceae bacterium]